MSGAMKTTQAGQQARPQAGLGDSVGYGGSQTSSRAISEVPRAAGEAGARDRLRLALAKRDLLVSDLAAGERAVQLARERAYDAEDEVERREKARLRSAQAPLSAVEEAALIDGISAGASLIDETEERADPELERMKSEARALRRAVDKLVAHLPDKRARLPYAESAVKAAVKVAVASSPAVAKLLDETEHLTLHLIRRRAILAAILNFLPDDSAEMARAASQLSPSVFPLHHPEAEAWRAACERLSVDASAPLPEIREEAR